MARGKRNVTPSDSTNSPPSKMAGVRRLLEDDPKASTSDIVEGVKKWGYDITSQTASNYRYAIIRDQKKKRRRAVRTEAAITAATTPGRAGSLDGIKDLLRAAEKLGWHSVKEVVDKILQAPK